jgi:hypothetical protein
MCDEIRLNAKYQEIARDAAPGHTILMILDGDNHTGMRPNAKLFSSLIAVIGGKNKVELLARRGEVP